MVKKLSIILVFYCGVSASAPTIFFVHIHPWMGVDEERWH